eukprot:6570204-Pyramimonas_sp.AAC.1
MAAPQSRLRGRARGWQRPPPGGRLCPRRRRRLGCWRPRARAAARAAAGRNARGTPRARLCRGCAFGWPS